MSPQHRSVLPIPAIGFRSVAADLWLPPDGKARREATDAIMEKIQKMSGQEYAGIYNEKPAATIATKVKRLFRGRAPLT